jgi:hypothetical protein
MTEARCDPARLGKRRLSDPGDNLMIMKMPIAETAVSAQDIPTRTAI